MVYCMFSPDVKAVQELYKNGDIDKAEALATATLTSIKNSCDRIDETTGCWIWEEGKKYPQLTHGARLHRIVAALKYGELGQQHVHHECGNACCVNPEHLQLVTRSQNTAEMLARQDYERFIVKLLHRVKDYNPNDPVLYGALPGTVSERLRREEQDVEPTPSSNG